MSIQDGFQREVDLQNVLTSERVGLLSGIVQHVEERETIRKGSSWYSSVFLVVNAALGAGLLNFPAAYHQAGGILVAVTVQGVFLVFIICAIFILAYVSDIKKTANYQDLVGTVCGNIGRRLTALTISTYCYGTCITFLIIIGDQWEEFFLFVAKDFYCIHNPWYMNRATTVIVSSFLLILPLCFSKRIDFLKYASFIGVLGILYVVIMVTVKFFLPHDPPGEISTSPKTWMDIFLVVPAICFAYQCHVSIIPIYSCMAKRNLREFAKTVSVAIVLCVINYTGTAAFGYLMFGDKITTDILLSFDPDTSIMIALVLIAIKTYTTYPILIFCGRAGVECLWTDLRRLPADVIIDQEFRRRIVMTLVWFVSSLAAAILIPNIGVVIQFLGALAAIFIFVFPGACLMQTVLMRTKETRVWKRMDKFLMAFSVIFIILGAFICGLTVTQSILEDLKGVTADKSRYTCTVG